MATPPSGPTKSNLDIALQLAAALTEITNKLQEQTEIYRQHVQLVEAICKGHECANELDPSKIKEIADGLAQAREQSEKFGSKTQEVTVLQGKLGEAVQKASEWAKKLSVPQEFLNGFKAGFNLSTNMLASIMRLGGTGLGLLKNIGGTLLSMPGRLLDFFQGAAGGGTDEYKAALEKLRDAFGNLEVGTSKAVRSMTEDMKNFNSIGVNFSRVFGHGRAGMANLLKENMELAKGMGFMFNRMAESLNGNILGLTVLRKATGMSAEAFKSMTLAAEGSGRSVGSMVTEMNIKLAQAEKTFGISTKEIGRDVDAMLKDTATFGRMAPDAMIKTSVYVKKLGISIETLKKVMDKSLNFEDAAQQAASLSEAFNMNIDAMKLMKEQDPSKKLDMIRESFFRTGRSVESLSIAEMKALQNTTQLSDEELRLAFSQKNRGMNQAQIAEQMKKGQKQQMTEAEAMQTLAKSIERVVQSGSGMKGSFFDIFMKGFERGITRSREFRAVVRNLQRSMREVYRAGIQVGRMFVDLFPGIKNILGGLADLVSPGRFAGLMGAVVSVFREFFNTIRTDPKAGFETFMKRMREIFFAFFDRGSPAGSQFLNGLKDYFKTVGIIFIQGLKYGLKAMSELLRGIIDFIKDPSSLSKGAQEAGSGLKGMFVSALEYAVTELRPVLTQIGNLFIELIKTLYVKYIQPNLRVILLGLFAVLFGPALVFAFVRGAVAGLLGQGLPAIIRLFKGASGTVNRAVGATQGAGGEEAPTDETAAEKINKAAEVLKQTKKALTTFVLAIGGVVVVLIGLAALAQAGNVKPETMLTITVMFAAIALLFTVMVRMKFLEAITEFSKVLGQTPISEVAKNLGIGIAAIVVILTVLGGLVYLGTKLFKDVKKETIKNVLEVMAASVLLTYAASGAVLVLTATGAVVIAAYPAALAGLAAVGLLLAGLVVFARETIVSFATAMSTNKISNETVKTITETLQAFVSLVSSVSSLVPGLAVSAIGAIVRVFTGDPLGQIRTVIQLLTTSLVGIIRSLSGITGDPAVLKEKAAIFNTVAQGIGGLISPLVSIIRVLAIAEVLAKGSAASIASSAGTALNNLINTLAAPRTGIIPNVLTQIQQAASSTTVDPEKLKTMSEVFTAIAAGVGELIKSISELLTSLEGGFGSGLTEVLSGGAILTAKMGTLSEIVPPLLQTISTVISGIVREMSSISSSVSNVEGLKALGPIIQAVVGALGGVLTAVGSIMSGGTGPTAGVAETFDSFINVISGGSANDVLRDKLQLVKSFITTFASSMKDFMVTTIDSLKSLISALPTNENQLKALSIAAEILKSVGMFLSPVIEIVSKLIDSMKGDNNIGNRINEIGTQVKSIIESLTTSFTTIFEKIPTLVSSLAAVQIPRGFERKINGIKGIFEIIKSIAGITSSMTIPTGGGSSRQLNAFHEVFNPVIAILEFLFVNPYHSARLKAVINALNGREFANMNNISPRVAALKGIFDSLKSIGEATKALSELGGAGGKGPTALAANVLDVPLRNLATILAGITSTGISGAGGKNPLMHPELFNNINFVKENLKGKDAVIAEIKNSLTAVFSNTSGIVTGITTFPDNLADTLNIKLTAFTNFINALQSYFVKQDGGAAAISQVQTRLNSLINPAIEGMITAYNVFATEMAALNNIPSLDMTLERAGENLSANRALRIERGAFNMTVQVNVTLNAGDVTNALYRFNNNDNNSTKPGNFSPGSFNRAEAATTQ